MFSYVAKYAGWSREDRIKAEYMLDQEDEYDVFLSFNGEDTRKGIVDHLYIQLKNAGFSVFKDDVNLPLGQDIAISLDRAIKRSRIVIPILSENYAASRWCMIELASMMDCRKTMNLKVLPLFYDVTPSQVKRLTGSYATAFSQHSDKYDLATIETWKKALAEVASLKGLELAKETAGCEGQFTKLIVEKVSDELNNSASLLSLTDNESASMKKAVENHIKGVLDIGGTGTDKKMLAITGSAADRNEIFHKELIRFLSSDIHWDASSYIKDIRKTALQSESIESLQSQLVYDLSMEGDACFNGPYERMYDLRNKFRNKKVLIVLEDVADTQQLNALAGSLDWFGPGSRIIVTTRNRRVCNAHQVTDVYHLGKGS